MKSTFTLWNVRILMFLLFSTIYSMSQAQQFRANLQVVTGTGPILVDGNFTMYNEAFTNDVDGSDAWKMSNFGENFGILRNGHTLVVERRRSIQETDTTFFRMWNMQQADYRLQMVLKNLTKPGLEAYIYDDFTNQFTPLRLNDTTYVPFSVTNNAASAAELRFSIIFVTQSYSTLPLSFTSITASKKDNVSLVQWKVQDESGVLGYDVEHSSDGVTYNTVGYIGASNAIRKTYSFTENHRKGMNFYRIKGKKLDGSSLYSAIARLEAAENNISISVYPNPVANRKAQLLVNGMAEGKLTLSLVNVNGVVIPLQPVTLRPGSNNIMIPVPAHLPAGLYRLKATDSDRKSQAISIQIL